MKEHILRECVNQLRLVAIEYHNHQSLRERILKTVSNAVEEDKKWQLENSKQQGHYDSQGYCDNPARGY